MSVSDLLDRWQSTDEKLTNVIQTQQEMIRLLQQLQDQGGNGGQALDAPPKRQYSLEYSRTIPANTTQSDPVIESNTMPFDGYTDGVVIGWPAGTNNLVGVQIRTKAGEKLFPRDDESNYVAADDFTTRFNLVTEISKGVDVVAEYVNEDGTGHFVNTVLGVREVNI